MDDTIFERDGRIGEPRGVRSQPRRDQLAGSEVIFGDIDGVDGEQFAAAQVAAGERAARRVAAQHHLVVALGEPHDHHLVFVLVGPEPGHPLVPSLDAEQVGGGGVGLLDGVVDRLEPHASTVMH